MQGRSKKFLLSHLGIAGREAQTYSMTCASVVRSFFQASAMLVLLYACAKDDPEAPPLSSADCAAISGYSMVDVNGAAILPPDTSDWRTTDDWCPAVEQLFADLPTVSWMDTPLTEPAIAGYPKPCSAQFAMWLGNDSISRVDLRIVDHTTQLVLAVDSITANHIAILADSIGATDGQLFRVYYRIVNPDGTAHRGHGDMLKQ